MDRSPLDYIVVSQTKDDVKMEKEFVPLFDNETVGDLVDRVAGNTAKPVVVKLGITDSFVGSISANMNMPVEKIVQFGMKYMFLQWKKDDQPNTSEQPTSVVNAIDILMNANKMYDKLPPSRIPPANAKNALRNRLLDIFDKNNIGFTPMQVNTVGERVVTTLTSALWYLDPFHEKLKSRGIHLPEMFLEFNGYFDWKGQKKREPVIRAVALKSQIDSFADLIMIPWFQHSQFSDFKSQCTTLLNCMKEYHSFLEKQHERNKSNHASSTPVRSLSDSWCLHTIEAEISRLSPEYKQLYDALEPLSEYEPQPLQELEPDDRYERRKWIERLKLSVPIQLCVFSQGNYLGNLNFVWKISENKEKRSETETIRVLDTVRQQLPIYSTRGMRKEFAERYASVLALKPAVLRDAFRYLTGDSAAGETSSQNLVDDRFVEWLMHADDPELFYDLRKNNGRPFVQEYEPFWAELQKYLEETSTVDERRRNSTCFMPFAISVEDLRNQVASRLPAGTPLPSASWIRLNFWPSNPYVSSAKYYSGRFRVKYAVQQRLLRVQHPDALYCSTMFSHLKAMAVLWQDHCTMVCVDDKAVIPIGEPGAPVSTGVRCRHRALVLDDEPVSALDHDFHKFGIVPSVLFHVKIPSHPRDSFYKGHVHVTVKDKVFQPSSAERHGAESTSILRAVCSSDDVNLNSPILLVYSDGGPDHKTTYWSVQLSLINLFICLDLDMLVAMRTAPMQSYANPAERTMSILNLGLQNVALCRDKMNDTNESKIHSLSTIKKIRAVAEKQPGLRDALLGSTKPCIDGVKERFSRLKKDGENFSIYNAATDDEISRFSESVQMLARDERFTKESLATKKKAEKTAVWDFYTTHCRERTYMFQIKKCTKEDCAYCTLNPPRLEKFTELHWVPDPVEDPEGGKYLNFSKTYGQETNDNSRPSAADKPQVTEADKRHKGMFVGARVRGYIICSECGKRRVYYACKRLDARQILALERLQEELSYTCGCSLFSVGPYAEIIVVREGVTCSSPIETTYYSGVSVKMEPICFYCGDTELSAGQIIQELQAQYGTVRPICTACLTAGRTPATRNALKTRKRKI